MRLVTYCTPAQPVPRLGVRVGHRVLDVESASRVDGEPLPCTLKALLREGRGAVARVQALAKAAQTSAGRYSAAMHEERAIRLLAPVPDADLIVTADGDSPQPFRAESFSGSGAAVSAPPGGECRCEIAPVYVIGRTSSGIDADDAMDRMIGITLGVKLGNGAAWAAPVLLGPEMATLDEIADPEDLWITCSLNGESLGRFNTRELAPSMPVALERATRAATLEPGDLVATAFASATPLALRRGDVLECAIEGVMTLRATIASAA